MSKARNFLESLNSTESWFINYYKCPKCKSKWDDQWDSKVDDDCGECGYKNISPYKSVKADPSTGEPLK